MYLLRLAEVQTSARDPVFRYSPARALLLAFAAVCASTVLVLIVGREMSFLAYYIAGVFLFGFILTRRLIIARFRSTNWLVRMNDDGVFIKFRSYLNYHLPAEDPSVVFIPYREILSARRVLERSKVASFSGEVSTQTHHLVEFELAGDPKPLTKALAEEFARRAPQEKHWYGSGSTLYKHCPVHMVSPAFLQIEWERCARRPVVSGWFAPIHHNCGPNRIVARLYSSPRDESERPGDAPTGVGRKGTDHLRYLYSEAALLLQLEPGASLY